jgi:spermidine/putrescine transport system permease protein
MRRLDFRIWGLIPAWAIMLVTLVVPIGIVILVSFALRGAYGGFEWGFSPQAYVRILFEEDWDGNVVFNPQYLEIILRTVMLAGATTLICAVISLPVAYLIAQTTGRTKVMLVFLITLPFWVSMIVRVYAWVIILGNDGVIDSALRMTGLVPDLGSLLYTNGAMLVGMVYSYIPLMILPVFASIEKLDTALIEASHDLYGSRWVTARRVIVPLAMPGLVAGAILVFVPCIGAVLEPQLLGGGKLLTMGTLIQTQFGGARNWPFGSAIAVVLLVLVMIVLMLNALNARRGGHHET